MICVHLFYSHWDLSFLDILSFSYSQLVNFYRHFSIFLMIIFIKQLLHENENLFFSSLFNHCRCCYVHWQMEKRLSCQCIKSAYQVLICFCSAIIYPSISTHKLVVAIVVRFWSVNGDWIATKLFQSSFQFLFSNGKAYFWCAFYYGRCTNIYGTNLISNIFSSSRSNFHFVLSFIDFPAFFFLPIFSFVLGFSFYNNDNQEKLRLAFLLTGNSTYLIAFFCAFSTASLFLRY